MRIEECRGVDGVVTSCRVVGQPQCGECSTQAHRHRVHRGCTGDVTNDSRGEENLPRIFRSSPPKDRVIASFVTDDSCPVIRLGGIEVSSRQITVMAPGQPSPWRSLGACKWCAMSMPVDAFRRLGRALNGEDMVLPNHQRVLTPPPRLMQRLQALHCSAGHLAEAASEILAEPEAALGLERALVEAMFACIATGVQQDTAGSLRHGEVMSRFEAVLGANPDKALYMPDVCAAYRGAGTSIAGLLRRAPGHGTHEIFI